MAVAGARFRSGVSAAGGPTVGTLPDEEAARAHAAAAHAAVAHASRGADNGGDAESEPQFGGMAAWR
eukprot:5429496-Heterocapsa_arctica.AAC.1